MGGIGGGGWRVEWLGGLDVVILDEVLVKGLKDRMGNRRGG